MSVTLLIITINIVVSLAAFTMPRIMETGMFVPYRTLRNNTWYELITSGFLHGGYIHLAALLIKNTFCIFVEKQWTVHDVNHQIK